MTTPASPSGSDQVLRDVLEMLADRVSVSPDAYHDVRAEWMRRQRRRKRLGIVVASALIVVADVVGLWALNRSDSGPALIFEQHAPANPVQTPTPRFGQP